MVSKSVGREEEIHPASHLDPDLKGMAEKVHDARVLGLDATATAVQLLLLPRLDPNIDRNMHDVYRSRPVWIRSIGFTRLSVYESALRHSQNTAGTFTKVMFP